MAKAEYAPQENPSSTKEFLKKWAPRIALVAFGFMALSWLL
jgi:hypothetical protein